MKLFLSTSKSKDIKIELVSEQDMGNYVVRKEIWHHFSSPEGTEVESAYTKTGDYIGDIKAAKFLCDKNRIKPQLASPGHSICSIGKAANGSWYGWSHRAIHGFKVGDKVKKGDCGFDPNVGPYTIETEEQAKQAAKDFAESVSSDNQLTVICVSKGMTTFQVDKEKVLKILDSLGCQPLRIRNKFAETYECLGWNRVIFKLLIQAGWTAHNYGTDERAGFTFSKNDNLLTIYRNGASFTIEFQGIRL